MGRKCNGDGSVYQRSDGRWAAALQVGTKPNGRKDIRTRYATSEAEAKRKLRELKKLAGEGSPEQRKKQTVEKYILDWFPRYKVDADNPDVRLEGAVFEVYEDTNGNGKLNRRDKFIGTMTETEPGVHTMENLPTGGYFAVEKESPEGFALDTRPVYFEITGADDAVLVENVKGVGFVNSRRVGNLRILKTSSDGKKEGFTFRIEGENYDETFVTDEKGEIFIENLRVGAYVITEVETEAAAGYKIPAPITVELVENETLRVDIFNEKVTITREPPPKTGDSWLIAGLALAGLLATGSAAVVLMKRRRKEEELADEETTV
jgi:LPXTG-motif cell wall-anchored protein